ncbi:hypothetical protein RB195_012177 [Necator americanus]|uniref:Uncharacterized protein n=1 Tax=Necator americanus TaxID=51031 RepID=A0ABR1D5V0_NECAM
MFRYLVLVILCQAFAFPDWPTAPRIDVTLEPIHGNELETDEDFRKMFSDFGKENNIHFNDRNFQRMGKVYTKDGWMLIYGLRGVDCLMFQQFLLGIKSYEYNIKHAYATCDRLKFSICLTFSCMGRNHTEVFYS